MNTTPTNTAPGSESPQKKDILVHFLQRVFFSNTQTSTTLSAPLDASLEKADGK